MRSPPRGRPSYSVVDSADSTEQMLSWLIIAPLGWPVVPEV